MQENNKKCKAITKNDKRCQKNKLWFSPYCWWHQPKTSSIISLIIGGLFGLFLDVLWEKFNPPSIETRRIEVVDRVTMEAARTIQYTDLYLTNFMYLSLNSELMKQLESMKIDNAEKYFNDEISKKLEKIFNNQLMIEKSKTFFESPGIPKTNISAFLWNLNNSKVSFDEFLNKYGSVDYKIVTTITKMNRSAEMLEMILNYAFKDPIKLESDFKNGKMDQFANYLAGYYLYQLECKTLIQKEHPEIKLNE